MYNYFIAIQYSIRLLLAALHYNNNRDKEQATTKDGTARFSISFPKYKKGGYIVRKIKAKSSHGKFKFKQLNLL